jgi:signal transduction histidine kinase
MLITLCKYESYYVRVPEALNDKPRAFPIELIRTHIPIGKHFAGALLIDHLQINCSPTEQFIALEDGKLLIIGTVSEYLSPSLLTHKVNEDALKYSALKHLHRWEVHREQTILNILLTASQSRPEALNACSNYTHSNAHSLWTYNPYTEVFTCAGTSHPYQKTFITKEDKSTLYTFLASNNQDESREPSPELCLNSELAKCKTLNRIRISLDQANTVAILNLYSVYPNFRIPTPLIQTVREVVRSFYTNSKIDLHASYEKIEEFFTTEYKPGKLDDFLRKLTQQICLHLSFECCSIFTFDTDLQKLKLVATTDTKITAGTVGSVFYPIDETSLTGYVATRKKLHVSYDLANDKKNSKRYSETPALTSTNWIGVPVLRGSSVTGVIRVKNKYSASPQIKELRNIRPADIEYLKSIATMLESLMQIEYLYLQSRHDLEDAQEKIIAQNDFNTVFLHEIKTPISTFSLAPYAIKKRMEFIRNFILSGSKDVRLTPHLEDIIKDSLDKVDLRLADISVMADRLKFIADTYFFDLIIAKNEPQRLSVLQDIVFPVVNITKEYFRQNYGLDIRVDAPSLQGLHVHADQTMLTLVLNALIDNAGKYTVETHRPVAISGSLDTDDNVRIIVSNYGLPIDQDEVERVFEKGKRGRRPISMKISGTGVGLHLGRQIMRGQKGELKLLRRADPVQFEIILARYL